MDKLRHLREEKGRKTLLGVEDRWTNAIPLSLMACGNAGKMNICLFKPLGAPHGGGACRVSAST